MSHLIISVTTTDTQAPMMEPNIRSTKYEDGTTIAAVEWGGFKVQGRPHELKEFADYLRQAAEKKPAIHK